MLRSALIAILIAVAIGGWIASGQIGPSAKEAEDSAATSESVDVEPKSERQILKVRGIILVAADLQRELLVRGQTEITRQVEIKAETHGRVVAIPVAEGARVRKGVILAKLALDDRLARKSEAEALVRQREIEHTASAKLLEKGYRSKTNTSATAALLDAARAAVVRIDTEIAQTRVLAPFDGVIEYRHAEIGAFVQAGDPIALLIDEDPFLVVAHVSERDVARVKKGMTARATLISGREVEGKVRFIATVADSETRTFRVEVEVPNKDARLHAGVTAEVRIPIETIRAHKVSPAVLTLNDAGVLGVRAVDDTGHVVFHPAAIVDDGPDGVWLAGLPETITVISVGQEFVRHGDRVDLVTAQGAQG